MEERPVVVVGSGPAGAATVLRLSQIDPELSREALVVEKARHPRDKVCAGGLIPHALKCLAELGVELTVPQVVVNRAAVRTPRRRVLYEGADLCRVIRRREFDASLVQEARRRGVAVEEGAKVVDIARDGQFIRVDTENRSYRARLVVGADGSGSIVRRRLFGQDKTHTGRAVMCDVPVADIDWGGFAAQQYEFSFATVAAGVRGYTWAFPCWIDGVPHANLGAYAVDSIGKALTECLKQHLDSLGVCTLPKLQAFPIHWYHETTPLAAPGVILAGDAAGVDPLMGEGISFALEYGSRAAEAVAEAITGKEVSLVRYERNVRNSWLGKKLRRLNLAVRLFYGPTWRIWFTIAERSQRAQELGLRWYNGVDGWDQRSGWEAVRALCTGKFEMQPPATSLSRPS